nr:50S ribosomal protein L9 [Desulfobacterales bacterium]
MKVILQETIEGLGIIGDEVEVADGYARNYLLPQEKALPATSQNRKLVESKRRSIEVQKEKEKNAAKAIAEKLKGMECTIPGKVSEGGRLYGSVSAREIVSHLASKEIKINRKMVILKEPIKHVGTYTVPIRLYQDIEAEITIEVVPEE